MASTHSYLNAMDYLDKVDECLDEMAGMGSGTYRELDDIVMALQDRLRDATGMKAKRWRAQHGPGSE